MNADRLDGRTLRLDLEPRNFEGRQAPAGAPTGEPAMAAAAAIEGHFVDVRKLA